jgi:hypothetical protein
MRKARAEERKEQTRRTFKLLGFAVLAAFVILIGGGMLLAAFA